MRHPARPTPSKRCAVETCDTHALSVIKEALAPSQDAHCRSCGHKCTRAHKHGTVSSHQASAWPHTRPASQYQLLVGVTSKFTTKHTHVGVLVGPVRLQPPAHCHSGHHVRRVLCADVGHGCRAGKGARHGAEQCDACVMRVPVPASCSCVRRCCTCSFCFSPAAINQVCKTLES